MIETNVMRAEAAWGTDMPGWVQLLAQAADRLGQKAAGELIGRSGGYVSRVLRNDYPGDMAEAERIVLAKLSHTDVQCPEFGLIPQSSCFRNRRQAGDRSTFLRRRFADACPQCRLNPDRKD